MKPGKFRNFLFSLMLIILSSYTQAHATQGAAPAIFDDGKDFTELTCADFATLTANNKVARKLTIFGIWSNGLFIGRMSIILKNYKELPFEISLYSMTADLLHLGSLCQYLPPDAALWKASEKDVRGIEWPKRLPLPKGAENDYLIPKIMGKGEPGFTQWTCEHFNSEAESKPENTAIFLMWIHGISTGMYMMRPDVRADPSPVLEKFDNHFIDTTTSLLLDECKSDPKKPVWQLFVDLSRP